MTPDPATVHLCAAATCFYCASPDRYTPAAPDADGYWHHVPRKGKAGEIWCEAQQIWGVLDGDATPAPGPVAGIETQGKECNDDCHH